MSTFRLQIGVNPIFVRIGVICGDNVVKLLQGHLIGRTPVQQRHGSWIENPIYGDGVVPGAGSHGRLCTGVSPSGDLREDGKKLLEGKGVRR